MIQKVFAIRKQGKGEQCIMQSPYKTKNLVQFLIIGALSIDDETGQWHRLEVKLSRVNLLGMRKVVKTSSSLHRQ